MRIPASAEYLPVPVLSIHVSREQVPTLRGAPVEFTQTDVESYFITPDQAMAGGAARKLSFQEAIQLFIV